MYMSSLSSPPHLVRPASRPFSGKNFGAVCSGVVGDGVTVVMVLADVPVGSPAREGAEVVCSLLPLLQRYGGSAPLGSR
jgi:hypothetical protein